MKGRDLLAVGCITVSASGESLACPVNAVSGVCPARFDDGEMMLPPAARAAPPHPRPPDPPGRYLSSSWRQWPRRGIRCACRIPAAGTHPGVHRAHPWSRRHRRRAAQSFPLHQRLRCCGHSLFSLAQETFRGWSGMASHQICLIVGRQADRTGAPRSSCWITLFRALSVATQRSIAQDVIDRSGRLPEQSPLLPPCPSLCPSSRALLFQDLNILCFRLHKSKSYPKNTLISISF
jgi:hypothetical protein